MDVLPPSPHEQFLRTALPDLASITAADPIWAVEATRAMEHLRARADAKDPAWHRQMAESYRNRGRFELAMEVAAQAVQAADEEEDDLEKARALAVRAAVQTLQGNFTSARSTLNDIRPLSKSFDHPEIIALYEETLASLVLRSMGSTVFEFEEAGERYARANELYRKLDDVAGQIRCAAGIAGVRSGRGEYFLAAESVDEAIQLSVASGIWTEIGHLLGCAAFAFRDQGYRHNVHELFELSVDWATFVGDVPSRIRSIGGHGELCRMEFAPPSKDGFEHAILLMNKAIEEAKEIGAGPLMLEMQLALASAYRKAGDKDSQHKCRLLAEQVAASEAFEGAHRLIDWKDFIEDGLEVAREERMAPRLEEAIEGSSDPFFVFEPRQGSDPSHFDLLNEFRNTAANRMLGLDKNEVRLLADLADVPQFNDLHAPLVRAAGDRESYEDEVGVPSDEGDILWYARRVAPAGAGAVVTFRDVTTSHRIEEALRIAADRAHEADRAKSEFLANMSHEVRTPINGVLGLARLLQELDLDPVARKYVDGIVSSGNILLKVIGDVLDLSKIEAHRLEITAVPVHIHSIVNEVVGLFEGQAAESKVDLVCELGSDVPSVVLLDGASLQQVLANLVGNAVKFTRVGRVEVKVYEGDQMLHFEVRDTGVGISEDHIDLIFEPFHQATTDSNLGGTGLGLTISRRLVDLMGGEMGVASRVGEGSCFFFSLPLVVAEGHEVDDSAANVGDATRFDGKRVLLVDDNAVNSLVAEGMVSRLGCVVTLASNGKEAVDLVACLPFDMVLMDMRMPVMDGLEATRLIRAREADNGGHLAIVALTAGALTQERDACLQAGMDDYLVKPFTLRALRAALFKAMG